MLEDVYKRQVISFISTSIGKKPETKGFPAMSSFCILSQPGVKIYFILQQKQQQKRISVRLSAEPCQKQRKQHLSMLAKGVVSS